MDNFKYKST